MARRKRILVRSKERQDTQSVASFLHELADRLAQHELILRQGDEEVQLSVPDRVVVRLRVQEKHKKRRTKRRLKLTIGWVEGEEDKEFVTFG
jgi:amphi-Trp domain-containing protein